MNTAEWVAMAVASLVILRGVYCAGHRAGRRWEQEAMARVRAAVARRR